MKLYYYSHRFRDPNPKTRAKNLRDAEERLRILQPRYAARGIRLWAPWIDVALGEKSETTAWAVIECTLAMSSGLVLDLAGREATPGMLRERDMAVTLGCVVEVLLAVDTA